MRVRWGLLAVLAGCYNPTIRGGAPCVTDDHCPSTLACIEGVCGGPTSDSGLPDLIAADAMVDAYTPDGVTIVQYVFGDDLSEVRDTEVNGNVPNQVEGAYDHLSIDDAENGMVWFDLTAIGAGKTITSATLRLTVSDEASEDGGTATVHRMREAWVESEATWLARASGLAWGVNGARPPSSDATAIATFQPASLNTAYDIALPITMVQEWVDSPASNYGLIFFRGTSTQHVHIHTRESATAATTAPRLTVEAY